MARMVKESSGYVLDASIVDNVKSDDAKVDEKEKEKDKDKDEVQRKDYELPDGKTIIKGNDERLSNCGEIMFNPVKFGLIKNNDNEKNKNVNQGIANLLVNSIGKCDNNVQKDLYGNIVLSGGNCMFDGLDARLMKEASGLISKDIKVGIANNAKIKRSNSVWIGGKIFSQSDQFKQMSFTKKEYQEYGAQIFERKCF